MILIKWYSKSHGVSHTNPELLRVSLISEIQTKILLIKLLRNKTHNCMAFKMVAYLIVQLYGYKTWSDLGGKHTCHPFMMK